MNIDDYMFFKNLPSIDLHGYDRETARVAINDFINDSIKQKHELISIIHGIGTGIIRNTVIETIKNNKNVLEYKSSYFNRGETILKLNIK